jgi:hypothetical protein
VIPIRIGCVLVVALAIQKLELFLLKVFYLGLVVRHNLVTIVQEVGLEVIHLDLQVKVLDCLLVPDHLDTSILEIKRSLDLLVEALLDTRMLPGPLIVCHRFA